MTCPYCGAAPVFTTGAVLYPHRPDLAAKKFWRCVPCDAYVGCHGDSDRPLGTLANASLRKWRERAHAAFDPLWKRHGYAKRRKAYRWLADQLGIPGAECHISMFDEPRCRQVVHLIGVIAAKAAERRSA